MSKYSIQLLMGQENMKKKKKKKEKTQEMWTLELGSYLYYVNTTGWRIPEKLHIQTSLMLYLAGVDSSTAHSSYSINMNNDASDLIKC